ncbi:MAG: hypothetical protein UV61_C0006G0006 [Candidatus Gottesmanbacteria bacterium GW2011_GWB1_43_11]|uniref:Uncharacterized protein n=1 Tax=Candidatus Gottesmanbacteria bacterium GW2011_GWB1_43_11 TaxID=1618446 RepID=A0A0G1CM14_9BACT|nr:MAG: hypothetical protein UV04_C0005G0006 [Candidatus Gottesmanbacteria bacterium GW2011_GWA2_42_16]KKS55413.1 MAG: hypothetical protein UV17_C0011G0038 [Candidatus Gottesmanbacteria bacterium GW2011_GWA1_42_26]KKS86805.1 MAG: hypothetical protein UV61_C0006G0006 [Candidatus Gottesmanbacteria bacterium GW2011_GWB1_43_11]OGG10599.1 MAG: hypothetical protein A2699_01770 [Candidatus Gottesmanbacteria bacterium RIFCSPHIGHO2_01_FULL_43_15]OGG27708.1 MAG: hypothetical protein A3A59_00085 [Candidat
MKITEIERIYNPNRLLQRLTQNAREDLSTGQTREYIFGRFAFDLYALWRQAREQGKSETFLSGISEASNIMEEDFPEPLKKNGHTLFGKLQPSLGEAIRETAKRLLFFEKLVKNLPPSVTGVILGGSISYGPFYNIRGEPDPSDLDIFFIVAQEFFQEDHGQHLIGEDKGFCRSACDDFALRSRVFQKLCAEGKADMISLKSSIDDYLASIKIFPKGTFIREFDTELGDIIFGDKDAVAIVRDYKQGPYSSTYLNMVFPRYNFLHEPCEFRLTEEYPQEGGAIVNLPATIISNGHLYTGQHHNHIIPNFNVEYDADGSITASIDHFKKHLKQRFEIERKRALDPNQLKFINCSDRMFLFSPQMIELAQRTMDIQVY